MLLLLYCDINNNIELNFLNYCFSNLFLIFLIYIFLMILFVMEKCGLDLILIDYLKPILNLKAQHYFFLINYFLI
jgi:succinate dehydrogenase hydrophobic anchor subunit